jgi:hypothetical protein
MALVDTFGYDLLDLPTFGIEDAHAYPTNVTTLANPQHKTAAVEDCSLSENGTLADSSDEAHSYWSHSSVSSVSDTSEVSSPTSPAATGLKCNHQSRCIDEPTDNDDHAPAQPLRRANMNKATKYRSEATTINGMWLLSVNGTPCCVPNDDTQTPVHVSDDLPTGFFTREIGAPHTRGEFVYKWCAHCRCNVKVRAFTQHIDYHLDPVFRGEFPCPITLEEEYLKRIEKGRTTQRHLKRQQRQKRNMMENNKTKRTRRTSVVSKRKQDDDDTSEDEDPTWGSERTQSKRSHMDY